MTDDNINNRSRSVEMVNSYVGKINSFKGYLVDQILMLNFDAEYVQNPLQTAVVKIQAIHTNTLSCTMSAVVLRGSGELELGKLVFVKLFDRRFSEQLREDNGVEPWTQEIENAYISSVQKGQAEKFLDAIHNIPNFQEDTEEDWDDGQIEAFLADKALSLYKTEVSVYQKLRQHQGIMIPMLLAAVHIDIAPAGMGFQPGRWRDFEPFKVKGLLLQYIEGCELFAVPHFFPRSSWQDIINRAVSMVQMLGTYGILNQDANPRNFIVSHATGQSDKNEAAFSVFMIDFALCRFRGQDESDAEWGRAKWEEDEDGAVGLRMQKMLKDEYGFSLHYVTSDRYRQWADTTDYLSGNWECH